METQIQILQHRFDQVDRENALVDMTDHEIAKTMFHCRARQFVSSLIKQRQIILNHHASHKDPCQMYKSIDHLRINLEATGNKNRALARYFLIYEEEIRSLIPGSVPNKRFETFISLRDEARNINSCQLPLL